MGLSRQEAFNILGVQRGSSEDQIKSAYKKLALQWHPDKHANSDEATKKFQDISAAYKRLTTEDDLSDIIITPEDMFDLFAQMFFNRRTTFRGFSGFNFVDTSDDDDLDNESDDDDDDDDDDLSFHHIFQFPPTNTSKKTKTNPTVYSYTARRPTASEASKNAEELMKEEERQRKQKEKKKAKKKRQKEKKRLEKEKKEQEDEEKKKLAEKGKGGKKAPPVVEEQVESSSSEEEDDIESEEDNENHIHHKITVDSSNNTSNKKNMGSKSKSSNNNVLNGHISGNGDASKGKKSDKISDKKSAATNSFDKKSVAAEKKTTPTKKPKKEAVQISASTSDSDNDEEETTGLDPTSAFFAHAAASASKKINSQPQPKPKKEDKNKINGKKKSEDAESIEDVDPVILRSRQIAVKGNEMANLGQYTAAVELFTQAIQLNPRDFRFFGNRSFCYDRLDKFDKALKDAERAVSLAKDWPKGYFRKGRALSGLRRYADAETAFEQVLRLDKNCEEAIEELRRVRGYQLMEMGFSRSQSEAAIRQYGSVQAALECLCEEGPMPDGHQAFGEDVYMSDDEDYITETIEQSKTDVGNPEGLRSLWIGNVQPSVTEKELRDLFGKYGEPQSIRRLQEKFCCFINFKTAAQAGYAMDKLQDYPLHGRSLKIKFPDNPIIEGQPRTTVLKKNQQQAQQQPTTKKQAKQQKKQQAQQQIPNGTQQQQQQLNADKLTGPVNGDECYFWRTTGCAFGDRCKYKHINANRGVDRKPWQKNLYKN